VRNLSIAAIMVVLMLGCSSTGPAQARQPRSASVEPGMAASQVEAVLGRPTAVQTAEADPQLEVWVYDAGRVVLNNGKVALTDPHPFPRP
jgi:hypothetical protein